MNKSNSKMTVTRKKFLKWGGFGSLSIFAGSKFVKLFSGKKMESKGEKTHVKMLTEDGKLVMVDIADLPKERTMISNDDMHRWIKK